MLFLAALEGWRVARGETETEKTRRETSFKGSTTGKGHYICTFTMSAHIVAY
jgi:hypothetical protein